MFCDRFELARSGDQVEILNDFFRKLNFSFWKSETLCEKRIFFGTTLGIIFDKNDYDFPLDFGDKLRSGQNWTQLRFSIDFCAFCGRKKANRRELTNCIFLAGRTFYVLCCIGERITNCSNLPRIWLWLDSENTKFPKLCFADFETFFSRNFLLLKQLQLQPLA